MDQHSNISFPIDLIKTSITWDELAIGDKLKGQINELKSWLINKEQRKGNKNSFCILVSGTPESGKTPTVGLLAKEAGKEAYKIDLRAVVSKYIGETEKNLKTLFTQAQDKQWILFFDEADALFGKRTEVKDGHDKYANQEVSYLLQQIESYDGLVVLATNKKDCIDEVFLRRIDASLEF
ncbi:MAG TPA: ATP-binding protein [Mucilaginibacter sp.]|jgi:SpoVK/Ycf46/Vps4 family AAA+-type ATPase